MLQAEMQNASFLKAVLSKPASKTVQAEVGTRIDVRPVLIKQQTSYQFTHRIGTQERHENFTINSAAERILELVGGVFRDLSVHTTTEQLTVRFSRKGVGTTTRRTLTQADKKSAAKPVVKSHDKQRQYLIPDGTPVPFLIQTGIMSKQGHVVAKHYKKFRQINRYVEFIKDVVDQLPDDQHLHVVDFGCGKSYLTFATHYLLTQTMNRSVTMVGLDRRADVVSTCNQIVKELALQDITFEATDIADYKPSSKVNIAVSLHACDTATDDAIAVAVQWQADAILAVPCCQHELAALLPPSQLPVISEHGILHERFSSLATDAIRANLLENVGYNTRVMEFIDTEHTPKNLLIRGIRRTSSQRDSPDRQYWRHFKAFSKQLALPPLRLQKKLEEYGLLTAEQAENE